MGETQRILPDNKVEDYQVLRAKHKQLLVEEANKRQELLKVMEPRDQWVDNCVQSCAKQFPEAKKAKELVSAQTKEKMMKAHFKEYDRAEFDSQFIYGLQPVLDGQPYHSCMTKCYYPKQVSKRASHYGN